MREIVLGTIATAFVSWGLVHVVRRYALQRGLVHHPNVRSSHTTPTPRLGGLGVVPALFLAFMAFEGAALLQWRIAVALGGVLLTACVGWLDDRHELPVGPRLVAHIAGAVCMLPLAIAPTPVPAVLGLAGMLWWIIWGVVSINFVNFMDGIDGLIGAQALIFGAHLVLLGAPDTPALHLGIALAGTALGFLWWNWPPAKIFLGDGGSGAIGLAMALGGLFLLRQGDAGLVKAYLPLYPLFLDATVTVLRRAGRGERITQPHRSHLYQQLANGGIGHARVSLLYAATALAGLAVAQIPDERVIPLVMAGYFLAVPIVAFRLARRVAGNAVSVMPAGGG